MEVAVAEEEEDGRKDRSLGVAVCGEAIGFLYDEDDLTVDEETLAETMRRLEDEISLPSLPSPIPKATSGSASSPTLPRRRLPQDGVESCGSLFSDSASTVMASIDVSGVSSAALAGAAAEEEVVVEWEEWMMGILREGEMEGTSGGGSR